ncbi:hypothetical protein [Leisingera sp. ANG59]|uniref:hypothetical protein n=1 Tax=Leisingera sp. ANG59 TaxID=2675221 RepID=UPI001574A3F1|nr:hypothetical protein [Leisingera sp. ANG59]NSY36782.1 hypothetical protein [Leisingera sp. ANG59]
MKAFCVCVGIAGLAIAGPAERVEAAASGPAYLCKIVPYGGGKSVSQGGGGWIPGSSYFEFSESLETVRIENAAVEASEEGAAVAKVKQLKDGRLRFKWRLSLPTNLDFPTPVGFRTDLDPADMTGVMRATVSLGYRSRIGGEMTCEKVRER